MGGTGADRLLGTESRQEAMLLVFPPDGGRPVLSGFRLPVAGRDDAVVEYKGADRYAAARMDREMGELWAELSDGKCRFVMATDKKWGGIEGMLK